MMRTLKYRIKGWKLAVLGIIVPAVFFVIACRDQVAENPNNLPDEAVEKYEAFRKDFPGENFIVETNAEGDKTLVDLEKKYGHAKHIELLTITDGAGVQREYSMLQFVKRDFSKEEVFDVVDQTAEYQGGFGNLITFLQKNISYPTEARTKGIQGTVLAELLVEPDGSISTISIKKGVDPALDAEALRVLKLMEKWTPAVKEGINVRSRMVLPIKFAL